MKINSIATFSGVQRVHSRTHPLFLESCMMCNLIRETHAKVDAALNTTDTTWGDDNFGVWGRALASETRPTSESK